jgi:hypothetical protein
MTNLNLKKQIYLAKINYYQNLLNEMSNLNSENIDYVKAQRSKFKYMTKYYNLFGGDNYINTNSFPTQDKITVNLNIHHIKTGKVVTITKNYPKDNLNMEFISVLKDLSIEINKNSSLKKELKNHKISPENIDDLKNYILFSDKTKMINEQKTECQNLKCKWQTLCGNRRECINEIHKSIYNIFQNQKQIAFYNGNTPKTLNNVLLDKKYNLINLYLYV